MHNHLPPSFKVTASGVTLSGFSEVSQVRTCWSVVCCWCSLLHHGVMAATCPVWSQQISRVTQEERWHTAQCPQCPCSIHYCSTISCMVEWCCGMRCCSSTELRTRDTPTLRCSVRWTSSAVMLTIEKISFQRSDTSDRLLSDLRTESDQVVSYLNLNTDSSEGGFQWQCARLDNFL